MLAGHFRIADGQISGCVAPDDDLIPSQVKYFSRRRTAFHYQLKGLGHVYLLLWSPGSWILLPSNDTTK
jgi:hypothetical protein